MHKKIFATTFVALLLLGGTARANNYLSNPGFETDLTGWTKAGPGWTAETTVVNTGLVSVQNTVNVTTIDYYASLKQTFALTPSTAPNLYAKINIKTGLPARSMARTGIAVIFKNSSGTEISRIQKVVGGTNAWRTLFASGTTPANTASVDYLVFVFAPKTDNVSPNSSLIYFDQAVLSKDALSGYQTALMNGGFENGTSDWNEFSYDIPGIPVTTTGYVQNGILAVKKVFNPTATQSYFGQVYQDIYYNTSGTLFPAGTFINARGLVRPAMDPVKRAIVGVKMEFFNAANVSLGSAQQVIEGTQNYRNLYVQGKTPANTKYVRISGVLYSKAVSGSTDTAYIDNFLCSLTQLAGYPILQTNLINPNFEAGMSDWKDPYSPGIVATTDKQNGTYGIHFSVSSVTSQDYYAEAAQWIDVNTSTKPVSKAAVYAKSTMKVSTGQLRIEFYNASGTLMSAYTRSRNITGNTAWSQISILNTSIPAGATKMKFVLSLWAAKGSNATGDTISFDNASIAYTP